LLCYVWLCAVSAGGNSGKGVDGQNLAKLDRETEELARKLTRSATPCGFEGSATAALLH
jgi:hypothetical protein